MLNLKRADNTIAGGALLDIDIDAFIERTAEAVAKKIDEQQKINLIAQAVIERLREMEAEPEHENE